MKKYIFTLLLSVYLLTINAQNLNTLITIDWKFVVKEVEYVNDSIWIIKAEPYDFSDPGSETREIGNYIRDNISNTYKIISSTPTTLTVVDQQFTGFPTSPQQDQPAKCFLSLDNGNTLFESAGAVNDYQLEEVRKWKNSALNDELIARAVSKNRLDIDTLIIRLDSTDLRVDTLETNVDSLFLITDTLDFRVDTTNLRIDSLLLTTDTLIILIDSTDLRVDTLATNVDSLFLTTGTLNSQVDSLFLITDTLEINVDSLFSVTDTLTMRLDSTDLRVDTLELRVDTLEVNVDSIFLITDTLGLRLDSADLKVDSLFLITDTLDLRIDTTNLRIDSLELLDSNQGLKIDSVRSEIPLPANTSDAVAGVDSLKYLTAKASFEANTIIYVPYVDQKRDIQLNVNLIDKLGDTITGITPEIDTLVIATQTDIARNAQAIVDSAVNVRGEIQVYTAGENVSIISNVISASVGSYRGLWDADTNTPLLTDGIGTTGDYYQVSVAGTSLGQSFMIGDEVVYNGTSWVKKPLVTVVQFSQIGGDAYDNTNLSGYLTTIDVEQVVQNNEITANEADISKLQDTATVHLGRINDNETTIDNHIVNTSNPHEVRATQILDFDTEVSNNTTVAGNVADIATQQDTTDALRVDINANAGSIEALEAEQIVQNSNISTNITNIQKNVDSLVVHRTEINALSAQDDGFNTSVDWNNATNIISVTDAGGTQSVEVTGFINEELIGANNGVAPLDINGQIETQYLPASILGATIYQGTWNASTNVPILVSGTGTKGHYYVVGVEGNILLDGLTDWEINDWVVFNGTRWEKIEATNDVNSVNGQQGTVLLGLPEILQVDATINENITQNATPTASTDLATVGTVEAAIGAQGLQEVLTIDPISTLDMTIKDLTAANATFSGNITINGTPINGTHSARMQDLWDATAIINDTTAALRADINTNMVNVAIQQDTTDVLRIDIDINAADIVIQQDTTAVLRADININSDSLAVHRTGINTNAADIAALEIDARDVATTSDALAGVINDKAVTPKSYSEALAIILRTQDTITANVMITDSLIVNGQNIADTEPLFQDFVESATASTGDIHTLPFTPKASSVQVEYNGKSLGVAAYTVSSNTVQVTQYVYKYDQLRITYVKQF